MSFVESLRRAKELLQEQRRLSARALGRELDLAGDDLEELIDELVEIQQLVARDGLYRELTSLQADGDATA